MVKLLLANTDEDLRRRDDRIKKRYAKGFDGKQLAKEFEISPARVYQILKGGRVMYCTYCSVLLEDTNIFNTRRCVKCNDKFLEERAERIRQRALLSAKANEERKQQRILRQKEKERVFLESLRPVKKICVVCGGGFEMPVKNTGTYCPTCTAHLSLFQGRERTREVRRRMDKYTCQDCGKKWIEGTRRFDIHHLNGKCGKKSRGYDRVRDVDGLTTLCHKCHFNRPDHATNAKNSLTLH